MHNLCKIVTSNTLDKAFLSGEVTFFKHTTKIHLSDFQMPQVRCQFSTFYVFKTCSMKVERTHRAARYTFYFILRQNMKPLSKRRCLVAPVFIFFSSLIPKVKDAITKKCAQPSNGTLLFVL